MIAREEDCFRVPEDFDFDCDCLGAGSYHWVMNPHLL